MTEGLSEKVGTGFSVRQAENKNVPVLRFPEFEGEWEEKRIGDFLVPYRKRVSAETVIPVYTSSRTGLRPQKDHFDGQEITNEGEYGVVPRGLFTYRHMSDDLTFKFNRNDVHDEIAVSKEYPVFSTENLRADFLHLKLNYSVSFQKFAAIQKLGGTRTRLYFKTLEEWKTLFPSLPEQKKIAAFLGVVDAKIAALRERQAGLERYKRGLMQALFNQRLRFTKPDGSPFPDWEEKRLGEVFSERSERGNEHAELLSVTLSRGVVRAADVDRANGASADRSNYKTVHVNDIAYNSMRMWQGANGVSEHFGIVSPAYTVITSQIGQFPSFWGYYFKLKNVIQEFQRHSQGLTSDTWNLKFPALSSIKLAVPHPDEQAKIADALSAMDAKIAAVGDQVTQMEAFKKGLLQQMFV